MGVANSWLSVWWKPLVGLELPSGMKNFARALRLALRYSLLIVTSTICATLVAVLWGTNISTVYPFVEVAFRGESMQTWVTKEIADAEHRVAHFGSVAADLRRYLKHDTQSVREEIQDDLRHWQDRPPPLGDDLSAISVAKELSDHRQRLENYLALSEGDLRESIRIDLSEAQARLTAEETALRGRRAIEPYIRRYLPTTPFRTLVLVVAFLVMGTLIKDLFLIANSLLVDRITQLVTRDLRNEFFRKTLRLDLASFNDHRGAELMSRFTVDMESLALGVQNLFGRATREPLKMLVCLGGAAYICPRLLALTLIVAPVAALIMSRLSKSLKRANRRAMDEMSQLYSVLGEAFHAIKLVKAFTMERYERKRFLDLTKQYFAKSMRIARYNALVRPVSELLGICMISLAIVAGAYLVLNHETHLLGMRMSERPLTLPAMGLFFGLLAGVSDPARKLSEIFAQQQRSAAAADRIYQAMDRQPSMTDPAEPVWLPSRHKEIALNGVHFSYDGVKPVLKGIDLRIPFGQTLAIVGPNGCGKSTLTNLLPRFYDPCQGQVTIDGIDIRCVRLRDLRRRIGIVTQETLLFDDTVFNNIRYGSPGATKEQVTAAARTAHAHRFIETKLARGYETMVGRHGSRLSGGQRQRIALARAILRNPEILILDEATSQIDLKSEQLIHRVLENFIRDRTAIIITHRIETLFLADRILVMDAGRILDVGTHDELLARCETYRNLHVRELRESA